MSDPTLFDDIEIEVRGSNLEGRMIVASVIEDALKEDGFTSVEVQDKELIHEVVTDGVMAVIRARNPEFFNTAVSVIIDAPDAIVLEPEPEEETDDVELALPEA